MKNPQFYWGVPFYFSWCSFSIISFPSSKVRTRPLSSDRIRLYDNVVLVGKDTVQVGGMKFTIDFEKKYIIKGIGKFYQFLLKCKKSHILRKIFFKIP